jgi:signal transduction histidine kinase
MRSLSIRGRLALWYGAALAFSLAFFAAAGFAFVARTSLDNMDASLGEALDAVQGALDLEESAQYSRDAYLDLVVQDFQFRDFKIAILDRATTRAHLSTASPGADSSGTATDTAADESPGAALARAHVPLEAPDMRALMLRTPDRGEQVLTVDAGGEQVRVMLRPYRFGRLTLVLGAAHGLQNRARMLRQLALALAGGLPILLLAAIAGGWLLARQTLHPVAVMTQRAAMIGAATLHERLPVTKPRDELGRLATVFNDLLARLDQAFEQQRQFMADASHELRTPVAIVSGEAELALSREDRSADELRAALTNIRHEGRRLTRIVDDLFLLARANAGEPLLVSAPLYLDDLARECVQAARSLAAAKRIELRYVGGDELAGIGDEALLRRLIMNLLDNAIKYTQPGGTVELHARAEGTSYVIEARDTGPGIPAAAHARLFDRFYRGRTAREAEAGEKESGAGLGLAIARWIAESHGGRITLERSDAMGSVFRVVLPVNGAERVGGAES